jgi:hypothetical protein
MPVSMQKGELSAAGSTVIPPDGETGPSVGLWLDCA